MIEYNKYIHHLISTDISNTHSVTMFLLPIGNIVGETIAKISITGKYLRNQITALKQHLK